MTSDEKRSQRLLVAALGICATGRQTASAHLCGKAEKQLSHLWAENERLRDALDEVVGAYDWWRVDEYDRDQSVVSDAIEDARAALGKEG